MALRVILLNRWRMAHESWELLSISLSYIAALRACHRRWNGKDHLFNAWLMWCTYWFMKLVDAPLHALLNKGAVVWCLLSLTFRFEMREMPYQILTHSANLNDATRLLYGTWLLVNQVKLSHFETKEMCTRIWVRNLKNHTLSMAKKLSKADFFNVRQLQISPSIRYGT